MCFSARCCILKLGCLATCWILPGAQLPLRHYSTTDGLASNAVYSIASDSRGFLWFATAEGLSRFDGYGFANQTERTGLPHGRIRKILIGRHGNYWLATDGGLIRFRPDLPQSSRDRMIVIHPSSRRESSNIWTLLEDRAGTLWCGTDDGLYAIEDTASPAPHLAKIPIEQPAEAGKDAGVRGLTEDLEGAVWIGVTDGTLYRRLRDRRIEQYPPTEAGRGAEIYCVHADRTGRIWVGRENGLYRSTTASHPGANGFDSLSGKIDGLPRGRVLQIFESRHGDVWVGMFGLLAQFPAHEEPARVWTKDNGLPSRMAQALGQDRDGNLWLGTDEQGAYKLPTDILSYSAAEIGIDSVLSVDETLGGELYIAGFLNGPGLKGFRIGFRSGAGFQSIAPRVPKSINDFGRRPARTIVQDHAGEWWLATSQGLIRYPRVESAAQLAYTAPKAIYTMRDGLPSDIVTAVHEDRAGNIWAGTESKKLVYWSQSEQKFIEIVADGVPSNAYAFAEDGDGGLWIGDEAGQLWRVRDGRASQVASLGRGWIRGILLDHTGRLWVASSERGLFRFDKPREAAPRFRQYGYSDGLSCLMLRGVAEDRNGAIYVASLDGVDRLDPDLGHIRHFSSADGIAPGNVFAAYRDRNGLMWFATNHGLTRLVPQNKRAGNPPVWISGVTIAGHHTPVSEVGESSIRGILVQPAQEHLQFDFVGLGYSPGDVLRYQYRLGDGDWSTPIEQRSIHYAALAPGQYRFEVRAVNSDGEASVTPATVEFQVAPPLWRRAWFQGILLTIAVAGAVWLHHARVARLLEIERVRMRIATDLHDDIGSSLSQIAILSEVAHQRTAGGKAGEPVDRIGAISRELLDSISDIVWAIQPNQDHLSELRQRMHRFAADVLSLRNVEMHWSASDSCPDLELNSELRRQVYLIFKECINNIARHSRATEAHIDLQVVKRQLALEVSDNGCGMEHEDGHSGNGLESMRLRAARLGGELQVRSAKGQGTTVILRAPLPA